MKIKIIPINNLSLLFYSAGTPLLIFCWLDQWLQMYLVSDKLRIQLFIVAIIVIAIAAIINLSSYIIGLYKPNNKNSPPDDH